MSAIIEQIIHLDEQIYTLRHKPRKTSTTVEQIRALETRVRRLWHERRVELAGLDCHLYDYEDAFGKAHMVDFYHVPGTAVRNYDEDTGHYADAANVETLAEKLVTNTAIAQVVKANRWQRRWKDAAAEIKGLLA